MTTNIEPNTHATDLASFRAVEASLSPLSVSSAVDEAKRITVITFDGERFTLGFRAGAPGVAVPLILELLQGEQLRALLDALQDELDHPTLQPGLNRGALHAFVTVLAAHVNATTTNRFEHARFGAVCKDMHAVIVGHLALDDHIVGTVHDTAGAIEFEQHAGGRPPGQFRPLSQVDLDSLAAALTAFVDSPVHADPLWGQMLADIRG